jgi:glycosyltransferase involved in cell wall biosynthesis
MNKVLIISYYWPPSGKASHHWPMKIAKHLPEFGWQPVVLTVNEDNFSHRDESQLAEVADIPVIRTNTIEPFNFYRKFIGKAKDEPLIASETISTKNKSLSHRISIWIRMNLFVPDARVGWYFKAKKEADKQIKEGSFKAIISIGPPHSTHLIGKYFSQKYNLPHIPVFIDPWTDIIYYREFKRNNLTVSIDNKLEEGVLKNAFSVIFVTETTQQDYIKKYSWLKEKSNVLFWGYDEDAFSQAEKNPLPKDPAEEILLHAGNIFDYQNPPLLWKQLRKEIDNGRNLKIEFIGTVSPLIKEEIEDNNLAERTHYLGFLPYNEMIRRLLHADYLLVGATEPRHLPGKLFEYLRAGKQILAFGKDNEEVRNILTEAGAGEMFNYTSSPASFFEGKEKNDIKKEFISKYDRFNITKSLSAILNKL